MLNNYFKVGFVKEIRANKIIIQLYETNNAFVYFYNGEEYAGISIGSYIGIINGPHTVVAQIDKEYLEDSQKDEKDHSYIRERYIRLAEATVVGYFDQKEDTYINGLKMLPMIYNESILLSKNEVLKILNHNGIGKTPESEEAKTEKSKQTTNDYPIVGNLVFHDIPFYLNWEKLFNTHIGIFGNTGSGKSNTLAKLYTELFSMRKSKLQGLTNSQFIVLDFNGEYVGQNSFGVNVLEKKVIKLNTSNQKPQDKDKIRITKDEFIDIETLSILFSATEKTQKPFIQNALNFYFKDDQSFIIKTKQEQMFSRISSSFKNVLKIKNPQAYILFIEILKILYDNSKNDEKLDFNNWLNDKFGDIEFIFLEWHQKEEKYIFRIDKARLENYFEFENMYHQDGKAYIDSTFENHVDKMKNILQEHLNQKIVGTIVELDVFDEIRMSLYIRLIYEMYGGTSHYEYISPLLSRVESRTPMLRKVIKVVSDDEKSQTTNTDSQFLKVISLKNCNMEMKKVIPLLLAKSIYKKQKDKAKEEKVYSITQLIIDEAHNILSTESTRETAQWKDYRLETFEELIKEGRKFGFYLTVSSQRPSDISETIISQIHNYFIHRLVNENDIRILANSISTLDAQSRHSVPYLAPGQCIVTGTSYYTPTLVQMRQLDKHERPQSDDVDLRYIWYIGMIENKAEKGEDIHYETQSVTNS